MKLKISFWAAAALAAASVFYKGALSAVICAAVHELAHLAAISASGAQIKEVTVKTTGVCIESGPLPFPADAVCAAAGPLSGLLLTVLCWAVGARQAAEISLFLSLLNLLPVRPLDGGRITAALAERLLKPDAAEAGKRVMNTIFLILTAVFCLCVSIACRSLPPLFFLLFLLAENLKK